MAQVSLVRDFGKELAYDLIRMGQKGTDAAFRKARSNKRGDRRKERKWDRETVKWDTKLCRRLLSFYGVRG